MSAVADHKEFLRLLLDSTQDLVIAIEVDSAQVYANQTARRFLGDAFTTRARAILEAQIPQQGAPSNSKRSQPIISDFTNNPTRLLTLENSLGQKHIFNCEFKSATADLQSHFLVATLKDITDLTQSTDELTQLQKTLQENRRAMTALNAVTNEMINRSELQSLLQHVAENIERITGAEYSFVTMVHESGEYLETIASNNQSDPLSNVKHQPDEGICGECWQTGTTVVTKDYQNYPRRLSGFTAIQQACAVPITIDEKVIGVLGVLHTNDDAQVELHRDLLEYFTQLIAVHIVNIELHEATAAELSRTEALSELSHLIYTSTDFKTLFDRVCITLISAFDASKAHIYQYDKSAEQSLTPLVAWEDCGGVVSPAVQASGARAGQSIAMWCIEHQKMAWIPRGVDDPRESALVQQARRDMNLGSTLCVPLIHKKNVWGILYAHRHLQHADFTDSDRNLLKVIGNQTSIALHRHELTEQIQFQAYHDQLTGLPNRLRFESLLQDLIERDAIAPKRVAVVFIDLDGFKGINDSLSHKAGDSLLKLVAKRFSACLSDTEILSRIGGDEFAVILPACQEKDHATFIAERLLDCFDEEFLINEAQIKVGASMGISFYPDDGATAVDLLRNADIAMYHGKSIEKGSVAVFQSSHAEHHEHRLGIERDLKNAIAENQFELHYQPKVCCQSGSATSVEALIRWNHPTRGMVSPFEFISVAEETGLIQQIGTWVLNEACRFGAEFHKLGYPIRIAVNISAIQFSRDDFTETVRFVLQEQNFPAECLELEVTESVVMKDVEIVVERLSELRRLGISIAIDDFGTGYSSLKYLDDLPLDTLKIDKAFVDKLSTEGNRRSLVKTIVLMAQSFELTTVAEGVETVEQLRQVTELGCDYVQGYYFSKPVAGNQLLDTLNVINTNTLQQDTFEHPPLLKKAG